MNTNQNTITPCGELLGGLHGASARTLRCGTQLLSLEKPVVMGILNVTKNSFYPESRCYSTRKIAKRIEQIIDEGGAILDVGACSTRPGSTPPTPELEYKNLRKAIAIARKITSSLPISVDTYRADVAEKLIDEFGVEIINDISGGGIDENMFAVIEKFRTAYILTHIQGTPENMQTNPHYENVVEEVTHFFTQRVVELRRRGVADIILDPGFGFGKSLEHNYTLLRNLATFAMLELPILAGLSRKSMIYKVLETDAEHALEGTQTVNTLALANGASILRVHDVRPAVEAIKLFACYSQQNKIL
ncbi:MAG: dihydropteroate synthase [Bacteroides sp.]